MHRFVVWLAAIVAAVALVGLGLTVAPLSATIQVLCKGVSKAEVAKCNPAYANDMSKMHWRMYAGHNCTNYVAWQLRQNGVPEPKRLMGNARDWVANAKKEGYTVDSTPAVGSVGAWGTAKNHITYVVEVGSNYIVTHEDNYPGYYKNGLYQELKIYKGDGSYPPQFIHFKDFISGGSPQITGVPQVAQTLTANNGTFVPSGTNYLYRWLRDGQAIADGTAATYTMRADDLGHKISYRVRAQKNGYADLVVTSAETSAVGPGTITNIASPVVQGGPSIGSTGTVSTGNWAPTDVSYDHQWLRNDVPIAGATDRSYTYVPADVGTTLTVQISASKAGFTTLVESAVGAIKVDSGKMTNTVKPTVSGTARVGSTLTADDGTWSPAGAALTRVWQANGEVIGGVTGPTYVPVLADIGKQITVQVQATKPGYTTATMASAPSGSVRSKDAPAATVVASTSHVVVAKGGSGTVNVSCTRACSGWVQVWSDAKGSAKSDVQYYKLSAAGWMSLRFKRLPYVDSKSALTRIAKESPLEAPSPQFNPLSLRKVNIVATTAGIRVNQDGTAPLNVSCTTACSGYVQLWSDANGSAKSNVQKYALKKAGWMALNFTGVRYIDSANARTRIAISAPLDGPTPQFNSLRLQKAPRS